MAGKYYNGKLKQFSRSLRKNMTKEERKLWFLFLRDLPLDIHRQKIIGNYIADFYCGQKKTVIELDGSQHFDESGMDRDRERDAYFTVSV